MWYDYTGDGIDDPSTDTFSYTWQQDDFGDTNRIASVKVVFDAVSLAHNRGNVTTTSQRTWLDAFGRTIWTVDAAGTMTNYKYEAATGAMTSVVQGILASDLSGTSPATWEVPTGASQRLLRTTTEIDGLGRTTKVADPNGVVTYMVYDDESREVRVYRGWHAIGSGQYATTGPVEIVRQDWARQYTESLTLTVPSWTTSTPGGTEAITTSAIESLSRTMCNRAGQAVESRSFFYLPTDSYTTAASFGSSVARTSSAIYLTTNTDYDGRGRLKRIESPDGTITRTIYDARGNVTSVWKGTDDTTTATEILAGVFWSPAYTGTATNMIQVAGYIYDSGAATGDGNMTESRAYYETSSYYASKMKYDWRDRLTDSRGVDDVATHTTYDNVGHTVKTQTYVDTATGTGISARDFTIQASELRGQSATMYDERGQAYRTIVYKVDPGTSATPGAVGPSLTMNYWYDARGMVLKTATPNGLFQKMRYDDLGRVTASFVSYDAGDSAYGDADDVIGDTVLAQQRMFYDYARPVASISYQRSASSSATTTESQWPLTPSTSLVQTAVSWYDEGGRSIASATYGRDNGSTRYFLNTDGSVIDSGSDGVPDIAQLTSLPSLNPTVFLRSATTYEAAGRVGRTTDNKGLVTVYKYDLLGRRTKMVENATGTGASFAEVDASDTDENRTTQWQYDPWGRLFVLEAVDPSGSALQYQDTKYYYGSDIDRSWPTSTVYPDSTTAADFGWDAEGNGGRSTSSTGTDFVAATYDRLGRRMTSTDQRGVSHQYVYDLVGRSSADAVTSLGDSGQHVDGGVRYLATGYDEMGRVSTVGSYDSYATLVEGGLIPTNAPVNELKFNYDG